MSWIALSILSAVALLWWWWALSPAHRSAFVKTLDVDTPLPETPLVSITVIVPARNEAELLPATIPSICDQDYPELRVVLVDDQSEDGSAPVIERLCARHANLKAVCGRPRPPGWCGKTWAVQQGLAHADTNLLLFTDADCIYHPQAVRQAVRFLQAHDLEVLSLIPRITFGTAAERVIMGGLITLLAVFVPIDWVNDPGRPKMALAAGGFILARRGAYDRVGGHEAVRGEMIEDIHLARRFKAESIKIHTRFTRDLLSTRMYEGWADLWEGLAKNAYAATAYHPLKFCAALAGFVLAVVLPPVYLLAAMVWVWFDASGASRAAVALAGSINLAMLVTHARAVRYLALPPLHVLLLPLAAGVYVIIALSSMWQYYFGGNIWKGRRYDRKALAGER